MLTYANSISFSQGEQPALNLHNFFEPENGFVWSTNKYCEIRFDFNSGNRKNNKQADLVIDFDVFKHFPQLQGQSVFIYLNGLRVGSCYITTRTTCLISINAENLKPNDNVVIFDTPDVSSPDIFGLNDPRSLAIQLFSIQIRAAG